MGPAGALLRLRQTTTAVAVTPISITAPSTAPTMMPVLSGSVGDTGPDAGAGESVAVSVVEVGATDAETAVSVVVVVDDGVKADGIVVVVVILAATVALAVVVVVVVVLVVVVVVVVGHVRDMQPHRVRPSHTMQFVSEVPPCKLHVLPERDEGRLGGVPVSRFFWTLNACREVKPVRSGTTPVKLFSPPKKAVSRRSAVRKLSVPLIRLLTRSSRSNRVHCISCVGTVPMIRPFPYDWGRSVEAGSFPSKSRFRFVNRPITELIVLVCEELGCRKLSKTTSEMLPSLSQ